jgi:hypothetical protein
MPVRLSPLGEPGKNAILVGDPRRAFALAQTLLEQPEMTHLSRGLWGYGGVTASGGGLTVQATGAGAPSAVAVISGLADLGVRRMIRLGSCVARAPGIAAGSAFLISEALGFDGASRKLVPGPRTVSPDALLYRELRGAAPVSTVSSHDLVLGMEADDDGEPPSPLRDLQTAATFAAARVLGVAAAALLVVAESADGSRMAEGDLEKRFATLGPAAVGALEGSSGAGPTPDAPAEPTSADPNPLLEG